MNKLLFSLFLIFVAPSAQASQPTHPSTANGKARVEMLPKQNSAQDTVKNSVAASVQKENGSSEKETSPIIIGAIISGLVLLTANLLTLRSNSLALKERRNEEKRKEINTKLNEFFGPFQQLLKKSQELQKIFRANKPKNFRALTYFLDPIQLYDGGTTVHLSQNDKIIFDEIIEVGKQMESLVMTKSGLVEDPILRNNFGDLINNSKLTDVTGLNDNGLLPLFVTHIFVMRMAYEGKIKGDVEHYSKYVFPKELPLAIERNIIELNKKLKKLTS